MMRPSGSSRWSASYQRKKIQSDILSESGIMVVGGRSFESGFPERTCEVAETTERLEHDEDWRV